MVSGQRWTAYSSCSSRVISARRQTQACAWSRRPIRFSASAWSRILAPARRSSRGQVATTSTASSNGSASRRAAISASAFSRSCVVAVALQAGEQEAAAQLLGLVVLDHRLRAAPVVGVHPGAGERRPGVLLGVVEVLDRDPPELALEHREPALGIGGDRDDAALDPDPAAAPAAHRADDDRAAAVDVAVEQAVQGDDRLVVGRRRVDEVDHQAGLLARVAPGDAADPLLVDAPRGGRRQVHADRRPRRVPALGEQHRVAEHVDLAALEAGEDLGQLALRRLAGDRAGVDAGVAEGLGDVVRVLDAGRVDDAGHLAEARLVEVGDRRR